MVDARALTERPGSRITPRQRARAVIRGAGVLAATVLAIGSAPFRAGAPRHDVAFGGRIIPADGGSLDGVRVVASDSRGSHEALVDQSGVFVGAFPTGPDGAITFRIFSDSSDPRYHTSTITVGAGSVNTPVRVVLIPRQWTIRGGLFAGRRLSIDPARATRRAGDAVGFWRVTRRPRPAALAVSWATDSFPLRVAFRRERGDPSISSADSIQFWAMAAELELLLGTPLFRPASFAEIDGGADGILVTVDTRMSAAGRTFITYNANGRIYEALVTVSRREYLGQTRVAMHELLHAIGFGHTGAWPSVMGPSTTGIESPSPEDIAYAQLYYAIADIQRRREAPFAIMEAVLGEVRGSYSMAGR